MENMKEIKAIENLDEMTSILKNELENIAEGFIAVGYYLKKTRDDELYKQKGSKSIIEYAQAVFGISRFTAVRFMEVNDRYSLGGYSPQIAEKYRGYGSSKLTEMLKLPEEIQEAIPKEATVRDIREAKTIVRETESRYSDQMELCDIAQGEDEEMEGTEWLEETVRHLFKSDCKEKFQEFVIWLKSPDGRSPLGITEDILALINPTKFKMVRLERANAMLQAEKICVMPYRNQGDRKEYTYIDLAKTFEAVFFPEGLSKTAEKAYEDVYGEALYPRTQNKPEPQKKSGNIKSEKEPEKRPEKKPEAPGSESKPPKKPENTKAEPVSEEKEKNESKTEPGMSEKPGNTKPQGELPEEIPGQMEIRRDFKEYCPEEGAVEGTLVEEDGREPEAAAGHPYMTRAEYMRALSVEEYAQYMARAMLTGFMGLTFRQLTEEGFWKNWLTRLVDESGRTIEEG